MPLYRLAFANNEVVSCVEVGNNVELNRLYRYEHQDGKLLHALIRATTGQKAIEMSQLIALHVRSLVFSDK